MSEYMLENVCMAVGFSVLALGIVLIWLGII